MMPQETPRTFALFQNYPNPFNPTTAISYQLSAVSDVTLRIYDMLGREVATIVHGVQAAGMQTVRWNASDLPSGVYYYRLLARPVAGEQIPFIESRKMALMK
jgi:flagellar hook assembly protein FlgD